MTRPAYLLPENAAPEGMVCIPAYIPNDPLYIAAFWGQYDELTTWLAWERDAEKRAKDAAAVWKAARDHARDEWIEHGNCGGGEDSMIRQKPDYPCIIQQSTDGGETWEDTVDMTLCRSRQYDPFDGDTTPAEAPFNAAAAIIEELMRLIEWGVDYADKEDIITQYRYYLAQYTTNNPTRAAVLWYEGYDDHTQDINDAGDTATWQPFYEYLGCRLQAARSQERTTIFDWLNEAAEDIYDWLNESSAWLFNTLEETARALGPEGLSNMAAKAGTTGFGGIEEWGTPECEWEIVLGPEDFVSWPMVGGSFYQSDGSMSLSEVWGGSNDYWCWIAGLPGGEAILQDNSMGAAIEIITYTEDPEGWVTQRSDQHLEIAYNPSDDLAWGEFTTYDWHVKEWAFMGEEQGNYLYKWEFPGFPENSGTDLSKFVIHMHRDVDNFDDRIVSVTIRGIGVKPIW